MRDQITGCGKLCLGLNKVKAYIGIVSLQLGYAGLYVISMVSLKNGMSHFVLAVYRHVVAFCVIAPFALLLERKIRPKLTLPIFLRIMALGFLEPVLDQNFYFLGIKYTSATFASAVLNVLPAVTFIMALIFRLEKVNLKKIYSLTKVIGTGVTVGGAMVMTLYKGPVLNFIHTKGIIQTHATTTPSTESSDDKHWVTGTLMLLASSISWAGFFILQSFTLKMYPAKLSLTALICLTGMVEGAVVTLVWEHDLSVWAIGWDSRLLAAAYSGVVCSGIAYYVQAMVIKERGPVFVTSFYPLCMIITAALGTIVLAEKIHLGSLIGAIIIVVGLYAVVWGKSKDHQAGSEISLEDAQKMGAQELPIFDVRTSAEVDGDYIGNLNENNVKISNVANKNSTFLQSP